MNEMIKKVICSKWTKQIIYTLIVIATLIIFYITLFIGVRNTYIDEICIVTSSGLLVLGFVKKLMIEKREKEEAYQYLYSQLNTIKIPTGIYAKIMRGENLSFVEEKQVIILVELDKKQKQEQGDKSGEKYEEKEIL